MVCPTPRPATPTMPPAVREMPPTAVPSWGGCQLLVHVSLEPSVIWLTVPVTEVMAPVTPLLLSGMLVCVMRIRFLYRVVRSNLVAWNYGIPIMDCYEGMSQCCSQGSRLLPGIGIGCYLIAHDSCRAARVNQGRAPSKQANLGTSTAARKGLPETSNSVQTSVTAL
jgi:hypothetical protein